MTTTLKADKFLARMPPRLANSLYRLARHVPPLSKYIERELEQVLEGVSDSLKPYRTSMPSYLELPPTGRSHSAILDELHTMHDAEAKVWQSGKVSGAVYHGDEQHIDFLNQVYALNSQSNPLHADVWPSTTKFEAEIVAMTSHMLGATQAQARGSDICGTVTSGGTESILLAMKTYRDRARAESGIKHAEIVAPVTAHAAFDKAAEYFGMRLIKIPVDHNYRVKVSAVRRAISRRSVVIVGSAPSFPHGAIDPIEDLAALAQQHKIGFHTDACLGGFLLPWAKKLGRGVPDFDFRVPGVTSMSADTHKFGYAAKGTSVVLYNSVALRRYQYFTTTDWPGGLYFSPTFAGSRPGALSAACWAAMLAMGEQGYLDTCQKILRAADLIQAGIRNIKGLRILGEPLFVIAFAADDFDIFQVMDRMSTRGWSLNGLHRPACLHICVTLRHAQDHVAQQFVDDLTASVDEVRSGRATKGGMAPVYGLAANLPVRGLVGELLKRYVDEIYRP